MDEFPRTLKEDRTHVGAEDYSRPPVGGDLRKELAETQGLSGDKVATWAGHLTIGMIRDGNIYSESGQLLGSVPPGLSKERS